MTKVQKCKFKLFLTYTKNYLGEKKR